MKFSGNSNRVHSVRVNGRIDGYSATKALALSTISLTPSFNWVVNAAEMV